MRTRLTYLVSSVGSYKYFWTKRVRFLSASHLLLFQYNRGCSISAKTTGRRFFETGHSSVALLLIKTGKRENMNATDKGGPRESAFDYSLSHVYRTEELIQVTSITEGRKEDLKCAPVYAHCSG